MKTLFISNIVFGSLAIVTVLIGFQYVNHSPESDEMDTMLSCVDGNVWEEVDLLGVIFMMVH